MTATCTLCNCNDCILIGIVEDYEHGIPGQWDMAQCQSCGFVFIWPIPSEKEISAFYPSNYYAYAGGGSINWLHKMVYALDARRIRHLIGDRGKILDIGCGSGDALTAIADRGNYDVHGVEFDTQAAANGQARGLAIHAGTVFDKNYDQHDFNLIRMAHVIEHMPEPQIVFARLFQMLQPGGILIGETPSTSCLDFKIFRHYWGGYQGPRHLGIFNRTNLPASLNAAGFINIRISPRLRTVGWSGALQNIIVKKLKLPPPPNGRVAWYVLLILPFLPVTFVQSFFKSTGTLAFYAEKPKAV